MKTKIFSAALALSIVGSSYAKSPVAPTFQDGQDPLKSGKWTLVEKVSDEFNGKKLDTNKWTADPQANGWGWLGRVPQLFDPNSVSVKDGSMQILVGKYDKPVEKKSYNRTDTYQYHSALVRSVEADGLMGYYYECRIKMGKTEMGGGFWLNVHPSVRPQRHEIDIVECVGAISPHMNDWQRKTKWDRVMHSNAINTTGQPKNKDANYVNIPTLNNENYHVYGAWWKSPKEILCFLDGKHVYTLVPPVDFALPSFVQFSIEMYDWNKIPDDGGLVASLPEKDRIHYFDWVRVWKVK
ncbi:MAG: hypothetical protein SNH01_03720 [Rikenellaceae bacterium]